MNLFKIDIPFDKKLAGITVLTTLLMLVDYYHQLIPGINLDGMILYFLVPLCYIILILEESPKDYGFQLGDWKIGLIVTAGSLAVLLPVLWVVVHGNQDMHDFYTRSINIPVPIYTFFEIFGWEFLFRGLLTFAYVRAYGGNGLWLQAVPFALMHLTKPEVETLTTIFGGFFFGWLAWRTKSFLYAFLIHWAIFTFVVLVARGVFR